MSTLIVRELGRMYVNDDKPTCDDELTEADLLETETMLIAAKNSMTIDDGIVNEIALKEMDPLRRDELQVYLEPLLWQNVHLILHTPENVKQKFGRKKLKFLIAQIGLGVQDEDDLHTISNNIAERFTAEDMPCRSEWIERVFLTCIDESIGSPEFRDQLLDEETIDEIEKNYQDFKKEKGFSLTQSRVWIIECTEIIRKNKRYYQCQCVKYVEIEFPSKYSVLLVEI